MPIIKILSREYQINCALEEEGKLFELAAKLNNRLQENEKLFKGANESLLIMLTALILEDQNQDLKLALNDATTAIEKLCNSIA